MKPSVMLTKAEIAEAVEAGIMVCAESLKNKHKTHSFVDRGPGKEFDANIEGTIAERAFAKLMRLEWKPRVNVFHGYDVGTFQVRWGREHHYDLVIRPRDDPSHKFALMTGGGGFYILQGCCLASFGMQPVFYGTRGPQNHPETSWFVPQKYLIQIRTPGK